MAFPVQAIADIFFGNTQKDRLQGLEIWTDQSILDPAHKNIFRVQVVPQNIQFAQRSRISEQVIKDGKAFFFWRKDRQSNHLDLLELQISGITRSLAREKQKGGNVLEQLASSVRDVGSLVVPPTGSPPAPSDQPTQKQREWLRFWAMTREPFVVEDGINHHHIRLNTPALPGVDAVGTGAGVEFIGHFSAPIQFSEVADNPFLVTWQLSLIVHQTIPDLDQFFNLLTNFTVTVA